MMAEPQIFIASPLPLGELAAEIGGVLGRPFDLRRFDDEPEVYVHQSEGLGLMLYRHDYESDGELKFDAYEYCVDVSGGPTHADVDRHARALYGTLRDHGSNPLMLVDDVQFEVARFPPPAALDAP